MNRPNRLLAACVLVGSSLAVWPAAAAPTKKECIAAINSGEDLRQAGKLRAARGRFAVCVATSCPSSLREDCGKRLTELVQATPTIVFEAKDRAGNDVSVVRVTIDGQPLAEKLDGSALPMDPGEHRCTFDDANGLAHAEKTIVVREGDDNRHVAVVLGAAPAPGAATAPPSDGSSQRMLGLVLGGVGIVGLGIGAVLGIMSKVAWDGSHDQCPGGCQALTEANASTVCFIVGGALIAGGAAFYFTAPRVGVGVGPNAGGADVRLWGAW